MGMTRKINSEFKAAAKLRTKLEEKEQWIAAKQYKYITFLNDLQRWKMEEDSGRATDVLRRRQFIIHKRIQWD